MTICAHVAARSSDADSCCVDVEVHLLRASRACQRDHLVREIYFSEVHRGAANLLAPEAAADGTPCSSLLVLHSLLGVVGIPS